MRLGRGADVRKKEATPYDDELAKLATAEVVEAEKSVSLPCPPPSLDIAGALAHSPR